MGYRFCECNECFETVIGDGPTYCDACEAGGCEDSQHGCQADHAEFCGAYIDSPECCVGCDMRCSAAQEANV